MAPDDTKTDEPADAAPARREITLDAVAAVFQQRALRAENAELLLAGELRDKTALIARQHELIVRLQAAAAPKAEPPAAKTAKPRPARHDARPEGETTP